MQAWDPDLLVRPMCGTQCMVAKNLLTPAIPFPRFLILRQPMPVLMLAPAHGDEREAPEVLCRGSGEECVPCAVWGEVERLCELRGIMCPGEESQCEGAAQRQNVGVRCGRVRECQGCLEFNSHWW
jgi:hypothetical protein